MTAVVGPLETQANRGVADGYCELDGGVLVPFNRLRSLARNVVHLDQLGADSTGVTPIDSLITAAVALLPVSTETGSVGYPIGHLILGAGFYRINAPVPNLGPKVTVSGQGRSSTVINFYGTGSCFRFYSNLFPTDSFGELDSDITNGGGIEKLTIDGTNAGAGSYGLKYGDMIGFKHDIIVRHFNQGTVLTAVATTSGSAVVTCASTAGLVAKQPIYGPGIPGVVPILSVDSGTRLTLPVNANATATGGMAMVNASVGIAQVNTVSWTEKTRGDSLVFDNTVNFRFDCAFADDTTTIATTVALPSASIVLASLPPGFARPYALIASSGLVPNIFCDGQKVTYNGITNNGNGTYTLTGCTGGTGTLTAGDTVQCGSGGGSHAYCLNRLDVIPSPNQDGVQIVNAANPYSNELIIRGDSNSLSASPQMGTVLRVTGPSVVGMRLTGGAAQLMWARLDILMEAFGGINPPSTLFIDTTSVVNGCFGVMRFGGTWLPSNLTIGTNGRLSFLGVIQGDATLNPDVNSNQLKVRGVFVYHQASVNPATGSLGFSNGDFFDTTPTGSYTITFLGTPVAGPQRKTVIIRQPSTGGVYNYVQTWPTNGSPTPASPTVKWANGVTPAPSTGLGAYDVYRLETLDGATWYGSVIMQSGGATNPQALAVQSVDPAAPASGIIDLYAKFVAGKEMLFSLSSTGAPIVLAPAQWTKMWWLVTPQQGAGLRTTGVGLATNVTGTISHPGLTANGFLAQAQSAASVNALAQINSSPSVRIGTAGDAMGGFFYHCRCYLPDASYDNTGASTGSRIMAGLTNNSTTSLGADNGGATQLLVFRRVHVNGGATDTTWQFVINNGGGANVVVDTTLPFTAQHLYSFLIWCPLGSATIYWQIRDDTTATVKTGNTAGNATIPLAATGLATFFGLQTIDAVARNIQIRDLYVESDQG